MSTKLMILRAELTLEAVYERAEFGVYLQGGLLSRLFERLQPHGLRLADLKVERGTGTIAEFHVLGHLFEYLMAIRVRVDKVEFFCSQVTSENLKRFSAAVVDALSAVQGAFNVKYRVYALGIALHGTLAGQSAKDYLSQFVSQIPEIGTVAGNAVAYYYGQTEDRIASTVTLDVSTLIADGVFIRPQATWDGAQVQIHDLPTRAEAFVRLALDKVGLEIETAEL